MKINWTKIALFVGTVVLGVLAWRLVRRFLARNQPGPRQTLTPAQKRLDDNAPVMTYANAVPPIATNVRPNAGAIVLRRNDAFIPPLYTLPAMGPNGNS